MAAAVKPMDNFPRLIHSASATAEQQSFADTFARLCEPTKVLSRYWQRAATETLHELRRHPDATRYALLAALSI